MGEPQIFLIFINLDKKRKIEKIKKPIAVLSNHKFSSIKLTRFINLLSVYRISGPDTELF